MSANPGEDPFAARGADPDEAHERPEAGEAAADAWRALRDGLGAAAAAGHDGEMQCLELCPICRAADVLRASGPPELRGQINDFQREALLTLRALLDHYIERIERPEDPGDRVEDIPIA